MIFRKIQNRISKKYSKKNKKIKISKCKHHYGRPVAFGVWFIEEDVTKNICIKCDREFYEIHEVNYGKVLAVVESVYEYRKLKKKGRL